jgi:hypothetical protein
MIVHCPMLPATTGAQGSTETVPSVFKFIQGEC